jgi:titin
MSATEGANSVEISWRAPTNTGDLPLTGYRVFRGTTEDILGEVTTVDSLSTSYMDSGLVNGVTYHYAIAAYNDLGDSPWSNVLNATPADVPGIPLNLAAVPGDRTVSLTWETPTLDGGRPILGYRILRGDSGGPPEIIAERGLITDFMDEGLINGVSYQYAISAFNNVGEGMPTEFIDVTPAGLSEAPRSLAADAELTAITLTWSSPLDTGGGQVTGFIIYRGLSSGSLVVLESMSGTTNMFVDSDLIPGTTYFYAVAAITQPGEGELSDPVQARAPGTAGPPVDVVVEPGDGEVTLEWSPPEDDGGTPVTGYVVLRGTTPSSLVELAELPIIPGHIDTNVVNGETYYYSVIAVNLMGRGTPSETLEATPFLPATVPGKASDLTAKVKGTKAVLTWLAPDDGGSPITGYILLRGDSLDNLQEIAQLGPVTTYTDTGLERGSNYYYALRAVNDVGQGGVSSTPVVKVSKEVDEGGLPLGILIAIAAVGIILVATLFLRPKRSEATESPWEEPLDEDGPTEEEEQRALKEEEERAAQKEMEEQQALKDEEERKALYGDEGLYQHEEPEHSFGEEELYTKEEPEAPPEQTEVDGPEAEEGPEDVERPDE